MIVNHANYMILSANANTPFWEHWEAEPYPQWAALPTTTVGAARNSASADPRLILQARTVIAAYQDRNIPALRTGIEELAALVDELERQNRPRLTATDVRTIRARAAAGERQIDIAADYNIARTHVSGIVARRSWPHIG